MTTPGPSLPRIILTSGEPAGIGPDLCLQIAGRDWPCELVVAGDPQLLAERAAMLGLEIAIELHTPPSRRSRTARVPCA